MRRHTTAGILLSFTISLSAQTPIRQTVLVPTRDGVPLATDVYAASSPRPVLLTRTPYDKKGAESAALRFFSAGYAVVAQDCRGRFASKGRYVPYLDDADDGEDTIAWIRKQPWSDGRVGMWGASHPGGVQWLAASRKPPGLLAIVPNATFTRSYPLSYQGGALRLAFIAGAGALINPPPTGVAPQELIDRVMLHLPVTDLVSAFGWSMPWLDGIVRNPSADSEYWRAHDLGGVLPQLELATQALTGYYDLFLRDVVESFQQITRNPKNQQNQRLILGPWSHQSLGRRKVGAMDFGPEAELDLRALDLEWFDRHIRKTGGPSLAPVRYFSMGDNHWYEAENWPPATAVQTPLYLRSKSLSWSKPPASESVDSFSSDPANPVPDRPPEARFSRAEPFLPIDYRSLASRPDVQVYTSRPLTADLQYAGPITMELWGASDTPSADWIVRLSQVDPDGAGTGLALGVLRSTHIVSARPQRLTIDLGHSAATIPAGHSLRIVIAGSCYPAFDRNTHTDQGVGSTTRVARQQVAHSRSASSHLLLPVVRTARFRP